MPTSPIRTFSATRLDPIIDPDLARAIPVALPNSVVYPAGQVLGDLGSGKYGAVNGAVIAAGSAPSAAGAASGNLTASSSYYLAYTYVNANGETVLSSVATVSTGASQGTLNVTAITPLPTGAASVNWYLSEAVGSRTLRKVANNSGGAFSITDFPAAGAALPPATNTALVATDGSQIAKLILMFPCATDGSGNITVGTAATGGEHGETDLVAPAYYRGAYKTSELTGLTAAILAAAGWHLISGTVNDGIVVIG